MMGVRWLLIVTTAFLLYLSGADSNANKGHQDYVPAIDNRRDVRSAGSEAIIGDNQNKGKNLEIKNGKQSKGKKKNKGPTKNKGQKKNRGQKKNKGQKKKRKAKKKLTKIKVEQKIKRKNKKKDSKRQQGKINNKKLKLKKIKQNRQKKKKKTASRQSACTGTTPVSSTCMENAMNVLVFENIQVANYIKQSKQLIRHSATTEKKQGKKGEFEEAAFHMLMAVGGNITNPICGANSTIGKKRELDLHMENYDKLMNCSAAILEACTVPSKVYNATALETIKVCNATMENFRTFTKTCMTEEMRNDATLQCACWAEGKTKMEAIKALTCSIDTEKKNITNNKRACVKVFGACKKMEDESVNLINTCMHDHSMKLINQTAESLHSGAMKDTGKALGDADDQAKQIMAGEADLGKQLDLDYGG